MDMNKQSAGRVPLRVNYWIAAIKQTIVLDKLNIYNLKLFNLCIWYMQFLKRFQFLLQRISSLKHDILYVFILCRHLKSRDLKSLL